MAEDEIDAVYGEKMIEVKVRFWTNDLAKEEGQIIPKHAWCQGVVRMDNNKSHGIKAQRPKHFYSLLDIGAVIESVLIEHGVVLHPSRKMKKYIAEDV